MKWLKHIKNLGPGLLVAATGVGAGDLIAASVGGANYGYVILWSAIIGAIIKYALNEGVARWQLASNTSIIEGWRQYFPSWVSYYFLAYLFIWSFIVGAALSGAVGLATHAIFPVLSVPVWGIIHAIIALILVVFFNYSWFEKIMKLLIASMFLLVIITTFLSSPNWYSVLRGIIVPQIPKDSILLILGIIGGVGGSVSILSYGYWIKEKNWNKREDMQKVKIDLAVAYVLTAFFALAIMVIAAEVKPEAISGNKMVLELANKIGENTNIFGKWFFLLGFWGAVFSSMLGVWQGIPFLFADYMRAKTNNNPEQINSEIIREPSSKKSRKHYLFFLTYLAILPLILLFYQKPVWIVISYAIIGSLFMPFLALTLYWLNRKKNQSLPNPSYINVLLLIALLLFLMLMAFKFYNLLD